MAKGISSGIGREILIARGLADWFFTFDGALPSDEMGWGLIMPKSGTLGASEEMVVLFANMLQGGI